MLCPTCKGKKNIADDAHDELGHHNIVRCPTCDGTGKAPRAVKATTKADGGAFAMVELTENHEWLAMANTGDSLAIEYYPDNGEDAEDVLRKWLIEIAQE